MSLGKMNQASLIQLISKKSKRERSITFAGHPNILRRCHTLLRSISNLSSDRANDDINASPNDSAASSLHRTFIPLFRSRSTVEKALSLQLNQADFEICNTSNAMEMHEFIRHTSSEENLRPINRSDLTNSGEAAADTIDYGSFVFRPTCSMYRTGTFMHRTLSQIKKKMRPVRCEPEKNTGYLIVNDAESDPVLFGLDQQETRNAQPCVQIHEDDFDLNQIQFASFTSTTPHLMLPQQPLLGLSIGPVDNHSNHDLLSQSTRGSVECGVPQADFANSHTTQFSQAISLASPSSTNSSTHEYSAVDRSILDDTEYVRAQQLDLERLTVLEIRLSVERQALKSDLADVDEINSLYEEALEQNENLKKELKLLEEEDELIYSSWACGACTYRNQPYIDSQRDICDMCEGPSPLKQATLIK